MGQGCRQSRNERSLPLTQDDLVHLDTIRHSGLFDEPWFCGRHPDVAEAGYDPLAHFHLYGWREGRWPNAYFDTAWYLRRYRDVRDAGTDPLLHYIEYGEDEGRRPIAHFDPYWYRARHGVASDTLCLSHFLPRRCTGEVSPIAEFDAAFYVETYPDVADASMDPFEHYLVQGAQEGRWPSAAFDPIRYRRRHLAGQREINPLLHFLQNRDERQLSPACAPTGAGIADEVRRNTRPDPAFEEADALPASARRRAKVLAFYLPQFHPVAENDAWWGRGFTEWANVARALPRFAGHYQPRIPRDLGHYQLDGTAVLRRQIELARGAGLHGFVYYYYSFNGHRLLDGPIEAMLADPSLDWPFCLMWANENWTRRWDGADSEVLIAQDYRQSDEPKLVADFARHFRDPRYIRLGGRPVLMVYRSGLIPDTRATIARWRAMFRDRHGENPLFVMAQSFRQNDPRPHGMDGAVEFPPHKLVEGLALQNAELDVLDPEFTAQAFRYADVVEASLTDPAPDYPLIKTAVPGWDNDARRQGAGMVLHGSTPGAYGDWLAALVDRAGERPFHGEALVCVNAWNEWGEGAYLEPDIKFGGAYLNATARAVAAPRRLDGPGPLLLVGHDAFPAGSQLLLLALARQLRRAHGTEISFLLLNEGALLARYAAVAPVSVAAEEAELIRQIRLARERGVRSAIVNTSAAARTVKLLAEAGISATLLVHELPRLLRERGLEGAVRHAAAAAHRVVFASSYVRDRFQELAAVPEDRAVILPQGVYAPPRPRPGAGARLRAELGIPAGVTVAMGLGHADLRKGFDLFLQVWRAAQDGANPIHLLWIGDVSPDVLAYLGAEMAAAAATGTFHHLPRRDDAADWFALADVHLLTSREDPFPTVVLEAMSAGVPTLAFEEGGGTPELLRDHRAGACVPLGDAAAMARAIIPLCRDHTSAERGRLSAVARRHFAFDQYATELAGIAQPALARVSVVVPSYNYARYMRERLRSIFAQTHPVFEIIVLDDASEDGSAGVAQAAADEAGRSIGLVLNPVNSGSVFEQWRRGAALAQGEWVWIAEADDLADPHFLATLVAAAQSVPGTALAFSDSRTIDAQGAATSPDYKDYYARVGAGALAADAVFSGPDFLTRFLAERNLILNASAVLWRREDLVAALARTGDDLAAFRVAGDWRIYAEALARPGAVVTYVAEPLNVHRRHGASVTHSLAVDRHLDEIRRMHRWVVSLVGARPGLRRRQAAAAREAARALAARE